MPKYLCIVLFLIGCNYAIDLPNIDEEAWGSDDRGCNNYRMSNIKALEQDKDMLKGLNQDEIIKTLGRPDENELYKRNQKFFIYNLTPHDCKNEVNVSPRVYLSIRFNATGLAKEVVIYSE